MNPQALATLLILNLATPVYRPGSRAEAEARYGRLAEDYSWRHSHKWLLKLDVGLNELMMVNKDMVVPLLQTLLELTTRGLDREIRATWGCYSGREIAGTGRASHHAYGLACDFARAGGERSRRQWSKEFVQVWIDHGFCWGGNFEKSAKDYMHFSYGWECNGLRNSSDGRKEVLHGDSGARAFPE